jgi:hypothetical protein
MRTEREGATVWHGKFEVVIAADVPSARCEELTSNIGALTAAIIIVLKDDDGSNAEPTLALAIMMFFRSVLSLNGYMKPNLAP